MKKNKILTLAATALMALTVAGCNGTKVSTEEALKTSAEALWNMYKAQNDTYALGNYDVVKKVTIAGGAYTVDVSWSLENVKGTTAGVELKAPYYSSDATLYQGVYVGYLDYVVTEETTFDLVPTLTFNGVSKKMYDILEKKSSGANKVFTRKIKPFHFDTYEEFLATVARANGAKNTSCTSAIKGYVQGISASGKYVYVRDDAHSYMVYGADYDKRTDFKVGDPVVVTGYVYSYNGCYEFVEATITKMESNSPALPKYEFNTGYVDATTVFNAAKDNKDDSLKPYQNMRVELKECKLDSIDGAYYWFTTKDGVKFNLYDSTSYYLTEEQNNAWKNKFYIGLKCTIKGVVNCYSSQHQIYPDTVDCIEIVDTEENKANYIQKNFKLNGFLKYFAKDTEVTLPSTGILGSTITWAFKDETVPTAFKIDGGKLKVVAPQTEQVATLVATIKVGTVSKQVEFALKSSKLSDAEIADKVAADLENKDVYAVTNVPVDDSTFDGVTISWATKTTKTGFSIDAKGKVIVPQVAADEALVATATIKVGTATKTKDVTFTSKHTLTVDEFNGLGANNKNEQYVRGTIVAKNAAVGKEGAFVLFDGTKYGFSYNKTTAEIGDEVLVKAKFSENNGVIQLGTSAVTVINAAAKDYKFEAKDPKALTIAEITEKITEAKAANSDGQKAAKAEWFSSYGEVAIKIRGYVVETKSDDGKSTYYNLHESASSTKTACSIFAAGAVYDNWKKAKGKQVDAIVIYRGNNINSENMQFQLVSFTEVK